MISKPTDKTIVTECCQQQNQFTTESHNWIKSRILIGQRSKVLSMELRVENKAKW